MMGDEQEDDYRDVREIADAICDGEATPEQLQQLEVLLEVSEGAQRFYLQYMDMHGRMLADGAPGVEIVMRRLQYEEVIVRTPGTVDVAAAPVVEPLTIDGPQEAKNLTPLFIIVALAILLLIVYAERDNSPPVLRFAAFSVVNPGDSEIDASARVPVVQLADGARLIPKVWRPRHYWSFDGETDRVSDLAGEAHGVPSGKAKRVSGLVGQGAYSFKNDDKAMIDVGSGGGKALATGSFAVTEGVTIEALVQPAWSGAEMDYDEIFRKDGKDGKMRMLLCFQNDQKKNAATTMPKVVSGPTLAFGLFLLGEGYHELELLLDGKDGRPALADLTDGRAHYVAATYDARSGSKRLYIDGALALEHVYPEGTRIVSGGPGKATIGNSPVHGSTEAFTGVIDEVAFYDFALPALTVQLHHDAAAAGKNYFHTSDGVLPIESPGIILPPSLTVELEPTTGLPARGNE
jgi:hypothetical protein